MQDLESDHQKLEQPFRSTKMEGVRGFLQVAIVAGALVAGFAGNAVLSRSEQTPIIGAVVSDPIAVEVITPAVRDVPLRISKSGVVQARNEVDLVPQVSGRVISISPNLASGGEFKANEVLFRLDDQDQIAALERAKADLTSAQADLDFERAESDIAKREWRQLNPDETVPPLVSRQPQIDRADARVASAKAALDDAKLRLTRTAFTLPFDGRITSSSVEIGQLLNAGQSYGRVYIAQDVEVSLPIESAALKALEPAIGRDAFVYVQEAPNRPVQSVNALVERADATIDPVTRMARVTLAFPDEHELLPGAFVEAEIVGPTIIDAHLFPERALNDDRSVWVAENGKLALRYPDILFAENESLISRPFDIADGVVVTTVYGGFEGAAISVDRNEQFSGSIR